MAGPENADPIVVMNPYYRLEADEARGRLTLTLTGTICSSAQVPDLIPDIQMAVGKLHRGFVALLDIRQVQMGEYIQFLYGQILKGLGMGGAAKIAEVGPPLPFLYDFDLLVPESDRTARMRFLELEGAEDWLNH